MKCPLPPLRSLTIRVGLLLTISATGMAPMAGCNRGGPKSVVVTGTVVYRGKPVDSANVLFVSKKHPSATGRTNDQGRFELTTFVSNDGTNAEEQSVCITKMIPNPHAPNDLCVPKLPVLPSKYGSPLLSPLKAPVATAGPNDFQFELTD